MSNKFPKWFAFMNDVVIFLTQYHQENMYYCFNTSEDLLRKGEELLIWILHKIMYVNNLFSDNVCQCNITYSVVHVELCFKSFLFIIIILYLCFQLVYSKYSPDTENYV